MDINQPGHYEQRSIEEVGTAAPHQENSQIGDLINGSGVIDNSLYESASIDQRESSYISSGIGSQSASIDQRESSYISSGIGSQSASIDQRESSYISFGIGSQRASIDQRESSYISSGIGSQRASNDQLASSLTSSTIGEPNSITQLPTPNSTTAEARAAGKETHDLENPIQAEGFLTTSYWSGVLDVINNVSSLNSAVDLDNELYEENEARPFYASHDELLRGNMPRVLSDNPNAPTVFDDNLQPQQSRVCFEDGDHLYDTNLMDHQDGAYANINIKEERRRLRMQRMCVICFERPRQAVNNPCQCVCYCLECARIMAICDLCLNDIEIP